MRNSLPAGSSKLSISTAVTPAVLCLRPDIFAGPICWSPDGQQILFTRFSDKDVAANPDPDPPPRGDVFEIWSIGRDGTNLRRLHDRLVPGLAKPVGSVRSCSNCGGHGRFSGVVNTLIRRAACRAAHRLRRPILLLAVGAQCCARSPSY